MLQVALNSLGLPATDAYVDTIIQQYDRDANGLVEFEEFRTYVAEREHDMWRTFQSLDRDKSGEVLLDNMLAWGLMGAQVCISSTWLIKHACSSACACP